MSEQDTREQLEADIRAWHRDTAFATKPSVQTLLGWLDRQAKISERELCGRCSPYATAKDYMDTIERLTAERDQLDRDLTAEHALVSQFEYDNEQLREAIDAMENGQFYAMYEELRAEVDNLRKRNDNQADTIGRLRAEFDAALDDLARAVEDKRSHPF